jgi:hypothetical protein
VSAEAVTQEALDGAAAGDWLAINTIRTLTIDAVQAAQSGRPGWSPCSARSWPS